LVIARKFMDKMTRLSEKYLRLCNTPSDINEHLPTLEKYASLCTSVFETGACDVSSYALIHGLLKTGNNTKILLNHVQECQIQELLETTKDLNITVNYRWINNLELDFKGETFDLTFIDTWHVYGQLKRELDKFSKITNKYIIMHDTTVDEWLGETIRNRWDPVTQSEKTGIPVVEINKGLWPAISEFLQTNPQWKLKERFTNNNGLTVLEKTETNLLSMVQQQYSDILKRCLLDIIYDPSPSVSVEVLAEGRYLPTRAHTMLGIKRMDNIQKCFENIIQDNIPGDFIETGVWRGGATIFMAGLNKIYGQNRKIYVADSFEGLPKPNPSLYPADDGDQHHTFNFLAVSLDEVKKNFQRYNLLDENVIFVKGFFEDSLKQLDIGPIALLRLDGDMYSSTIQVLDILYDKVVPGSYVIIDDYMAVYGCRKAVDDFRTSRNITDELIIIDYSGRYWKKQ
jgi:O-methyltransferase